MTQKEMDLQLGRLVREFKDSSTKVALYQYEMLCLSRTFQGIAQALEKLSEDIVCPEMPVIDSGNLLEDTLSVSKKLIDEVFVRDDLHKRLVLLGVELPLEHEM